MSYKPYTLQPEDGVGYTLTQLRVAAGITKGKMAQVLNVHPDTITRYESHTSTISLSQAVKYCDFLDIEISVRYR